MLVDAGTETVLWARRPELAEAISREHVNPDYLAGLPLPHVAAGHRRPAPRRWTSAELVVLASRPRRCAPT